MLPKNIPCVTRLSLLMHAFNPHASTKVLSDNVELRYHYEILNRPTRNKSDQKRNVPRQLRIVPRYVETFKKHRLCDDDGDYAVDRVSHEPCIVNGIE
jgi:hypothetical protein